MGKAKSGVKGVVSAMVGATHHAIAIKALTRNASIVEESASPEKSRLHAQHVKLNQANHARLPSRTGHMSEECTTLGLSKHGALLKMLKKFPTAEPALCESNLK